MVFAKGIVVELFLVAVKIAECDLFCGLGLSKFGEKCRWQGWKCFLPCGGNC